MDIVQKKVLLSFVYALYANSVCPRKYKTICCSLVLSITLEVHQGYQQMMQTNASDDLLLKHESQTLANDSIKVQDPVNLVLLSFLKIFETVQHLRQAQRKSDRVLFFSPENFKIFKRTPSLFLCACLI